MKAVLQYRASLGLRQRIAALDIDTVVVGANDADMFLRAMDDAEVLLHVLEIEPPDTELDAWSLTDLVAFSRGTQGAGLALAQVLACCGAPVAIIGRPGAGEDSRLMTGLERLSSAGARVIFETVDVANPAELAAAMHRIQRRLGPVTAVGHSAPAGQPRLAAELTEGDIAEHVSAGAAGLAQLLGR